MSCEARQVGDQMMCACGVAWDVADKERPRCRRQRHVEPGKVPAEVRQATEADRRTGPQDRRARRPSITLEVPLELPADVAREMAKAIGLSGGPDDVAALRQAHRVLLDRLA